MTEKNEFGADKVTLPPEEARLRHDETFSQPAIDIASQQATTTFDPDGNGLSIAFYHQQECITLPELQNKAKRVQKFLRRTKAIHEQLQQTPNCKYLLNDVRERLVSLTNRALSQASPLDETELPDVNDNLKIQMTLYKSNLQTAKATAENHRQFGNES